MNDGGQLLQLPSRHPPQVIDMAGLIQAFGYSERWWRYRIAEGMPHHRWGKRLRFEPDDVKQWLDERYRDG